MGAVNCIVVSERAIVWTDAGQYDDSGRLVAIAPNCIDVDNCRLVIVSQAFSPALFAWRNHLVRSGADIDMVVRDEGQLFDAYLDQAAVQFADLDSVFWCVGWSPIDNAALIVQVDAEQSARDRIRRVKSVMLPAVAPVDRSAIDVVLAMAPSPAAVDLAAFGTALLSAQRQIPIGQESDGAGRYRIGGYVLQTEVSRLGIQHEIIHTWADTIGERTDPFRLSGF
jgi:hypothetical protein